MFEKVMIASVVFSLLLIIIAKLTAKEVNNIYKVIKKAEKLNGLMGQALKSIDPLAGNICNSINFLDKRTLDLVNKFDDTINAVTQHNQEYLAFLDYRNKIEVEKRKEEEIKKYQEIEKKTNEELKIREEKYLNNKNAVEPNVNYDSDSYLGVLTDKFCPFCKSPLMKNNLGQEWCSCSSCNYGLDPIYYDDNEFPGPFDERSKEINSSEEETELISFDQIDSNDKFLKELFFESEKERDNDPVLSQVYSNYNKTIEEKDTIQR